MQDPPSLGRTGLFMACARRHDYTFRRCFNLRGQSPWDLSLANSDFPVSVDDARKLVEHASVILTS
ncbi:MAG: hypothetical protein KC561_14890, partial [Myxococcales bacterium]|nr:hypothetical protein [Myxococcales bacterium]